MSIIEEILEREIKERDERLIRICEDVKASVDRVHAHVEHAHKTLDEIKELNGALEIERDHLERVATA